LAADYTAVSGDMAFVPPVQPGDNSIRFVNANPVQIKDTYCQFLANNERYRIMAAAINALRLASILDTCTKKLRIIGLVYNTISLLNILSALVGPLLATFKHYFSGKMRLFKPQDNPFSLVIQGIKADPPIRSWPVADRKDNQ
jgi:hypothetical protein